MNLKSLKNTGSFQVMKLCPAISYKNNCILKIYGWQTVLLSLQNTRFIGFLHGQRPLMSQPSEWIHRIDVVRVPGALCTKKAAVGGQKIFWISGTLRPGARSFRNTNPPGGWGGVLRTFVLKNFCQKMCVLKPYV